MMNETYVYTILYYICSIITFMSFWLDSEEESKIGPWYNLFPHRIGYITNTV